MNFWLIVFLLGAVFVLTYNPKSRTLEKIIEVQPKQEQCEAERFQRLQFIGTLQFMGRIALGVQQRHHHILKTMAPKIRKSVA